MPHERALGVDRALGVAGATGAVDDDYRIRRNDAALHRREVCLFSPGALASGDDAGLASARPRPIGVSQDVDHAKKWGLGKEQGAVGALPGQSGERCLEAVEVVRLEEVWTRDEVRQIGMTDRPSEFTCLIEGVDGNED